MKESVIVDSIKKHLATVKDCFFYKQFGGSYGVAGIPDLIVCYNGRFIAFEVKTETGKATVLQKITINKIIKAGGIAVIVRSVDEVKQIINSLK